MAHTTAFASAANTVIAMQTRRQERIFSCRLSSNLPVPFQLYERGLCEEMNAVSRWNCLRSDAQAPGLRDVHRDPPRFVRYGLPAQLLCPDCEAQQPAIAIGCFAAAVKCHSMTILASSCVDQQ